MQALIGLALLMLCEVVLGGQTGETAGALYVRGEAGYRGNNPLARPLVGARETFLQRVALEPKDPPATLQLARSALQAHDGTVALRHLDSLPLAVQSSLQARLLRAEALCWAGDRQAGMALVDQLESEIGKDGREHSAVGLLLARVGEYQRAEAAFTRALESRPTDFATLYNLGLAAAKAGHFERAGQAFESALRQRPKDPDCLLNLGQVYDGRKEYAKGAELLARAAQVAPARPDIQLALARALEHAGYVGDSAQAYDRYSELVPEDDRARRDRAVVYASAGSVGKALSELAWYAKRHPEDPLAAYYTALLLETSEPERALAQVDAALRLDPELAPAALLRARLLLNEGQAEAALRQLKIAVQRSPDDVPILKQLGVNYLALDQPAASEQVLRKAVALAPGDDKSWRLLGRALMQMGRKEEGLDAFAKARQLGSAPVLIQQSAGAVELLQLSPAQRRDRQIEIFSKSMLSRPTDRELKLELGKLCLASGRSEQARQVFTNLLKLETSAKVSQDAGQALSTAGQFDLALEFFRRAVVEEPSTRADLALLLMHMGRPESGLAELEKVPEEARTPQYHLVRALIMNALQRRDDAALELNRGFLSGAASPELTLEAARLLISYDRKGEALQLVEWAAAGDDLQLARAWLLGELGRADAAMAVIRKIQSNRPEWGKPYVVESNLLERSGSIEKALSAMETASALGEQAALIPDRIKHLRRAGSRQLAAVDQRLSEASLVAFLFAFTAGP